MARGWLWNGEGNRAERGRNRLGAARWYLRGQLRQLPFKHLETITEVTSDRMNNQALMWRSTPMGTSCPGSEYRVSCTSWSELLMKNRKIHACEYRNCRLLFPLKWGLLPVFKGSWSLWEVDGHCGQFSKKIYNFHTHRNCPLPQSSPQVENSLKNLWRLY